jgi:hypothetical protein
MSFLAEIFAEFLSWFALRKADKSYKEDKKARGNLYLLLFLILLVTITVYILWDWLLTG